MKAEFILLMAMIVAVTLALTGNAFLAFGVFIVAIVGVA